MKIDILKCNTCGHYSLKKACRQCRGECLSPKPAKYSVEDKWGHYRRMYKIEQEIAKN